MPELRLSYHARSRWQERVGKPIPSPEELKQLIDESVVIQKAQSLFTTRGHAVHVLALYWHQDCGIVLKVDHLKSIVVTILAPKVASEG